MSCSRGDGPPNREGIVGVAASRCSARERMTAKLVRVRVKTQFLWEDGCRVSVEGEAKGVREGRGSENAGSRRRGNEREREAEMTMRQQEQLCRQTAATQEERGRGG